MTFGKQNRTDPPQNKKHLNSESDLRGVHDQPANLAEDDEGGGPGGFGVGEGEVGDAVEEGEEGVDGGVAAAEVVGSGGLRAQKIWGGFVGSYVGTEKEG